jgi:hypothetical protein
MYCLFFLFTMLKMPYFRLMYCRSTSLNVKRFIICQRMGLFGVDGFALCCFFFRTSLFFVNIVKIISVYVYSFKKVSGYSYTIKLSKLFLCISHRSKNEVKQREQNVVFFEKKFWICNFTMFMLICWISWSDAREDVSLYI